MRECIMCVSVSGWPLARHEGMCKEPDSALVCAACHLRMPAFLCHSGSP